MEANDGQLKIIEEAADFYYNSSEQVYQFVGEPGTGKSFTLNKIVERLGLTQDEILPMAFTGQAAIVMRTKGLIHAKTCHATVLEPTLVPLIDKATGRQAISKTYNMPIMVWEFTSKYLDRSRYKLMIVDEGYTVPLSLKREIEKHGIKIIVTGDTSQLPPVADNPAYLVNGRISHLTELMRQAEDSPIVYLAQRAKRGWPIQNGQYGSCLVINERDVTDDMLKLSQIVITGTNKMREKYNRTIREDILGIHRDIPTIGERVICRKNNWGENIGDISLVNGLQGIVYNMPDVSAFDGNTFKMDFKPDLLNLPFENLMCDYKYFVADHANKQIIKGSPFAIGEKFDFAYASTTHLSQGSEYNFGMYMEESLGVMSPKLNFTAITRFREGLIYVKTGKGFF